VRRVPSLSGAPVFAVRWDLTRGLWAATSDEVRLNAGYQLRVALGPIKREGIIWYRVWSPAQPGQSSEEMVLLDADADDQFGDEAWIAAAQGAESYLEPMPDPDGQLTNAPLLFVAGSSGTFVSEPFDAATQVVGDWALSTNDLAPCDFMVTLEPAGAVLATDSLEGFLTEGRIASSTDLTAGELRVRVTSGVRDHPEAACSWALAIL
jgi:hypothetical protein